MTSAERVTGGTPDSRLLPPLFPSVWETRLLLELLCHPAAPAVRGAVVHLETELLQVRVADASALFRCRLQLEGIDEEPRGRILRIVTRTWNATGQQCTETRSGFLLREHRGARGAVSRRDDGEEDGTAGDWAEVARWKLRGNHGRRYARASGDYNPAHLSRLTAVALGFPRAILHGYCTAALVTHELLGRYRAGDPASLRRLRIQFVRPILLPSRPRLVAAEAGSRILFQVVDDRDRVQARGELAASS